MKIIRNWKKALGHFSTMALTLSAGITATWLAVPEELKVLIPQKEMAIVTGIVAVAGLVGKFIDQKKPAERAVDDAVAQVKPELLDTYLNRGKGVVIDKLKEALK